MDAKKSFRGQKNTSGMEAGKSFALYRAKWDIKTKMDVLKASINFSSSSKKRTKKKKQFLCLANFQLIFVLNCCQIFIILNEKVYDQ